MTIVYVAKCKLNNMVYIGKTDRTFPQRKKEHLDAARQGDSARFHRELLEQGFANWRWDKLAECDRDKAFVVEREYIKKFRVQGLDLLNYTHNPKQAVRTSSLSRLLM